MQPGSHARHEAVSGMHPATGATRELNGTTAVAEGEST
tara:strand:- start:106 stop:219 length:114 start_codon:yes stop_codon:yes gene_type:complete